MLTTFIDFNFSLLATPGCTTTGTGLNHEKLGAYKPGYQKKILNLVLMKSKTFLKILFKSDNCLILRLSTATQLTTNSLLAWNQFSFLDEQKRFILLQKLRKSVKIKYLDKQNEHAIDFYWLIDQIYWLFFINKQFIDTDFYWLTTPG